MKFLHYLLVFLFVFTSCKSKKNIMKSGIIVREMSAKKVSKKHSASSFDVETVSAKLKVSFSNGRLKLKPNISLKIKKDEVIWIKASKFLLLFKAKITPKVVSFYIPLNQSFFEGDFKSLKKYLGFEVSFKQLQNFFLGQSLINLEDHKLEVRIENNKYVLSPKKQRLLYDVFFAINPTNFKLYKQSVVVLEKNQSVEVLYPKYKYINNVYFPSEINIRAKQLNKFTNIDFELKQLELGKEIDTSFSIPKGYKQIYLY